MDDCSPDDPGAITRRFDDPRIKHIRNEVNLGHLRNYNKGLSLAQGQYVWLISADDLLYGRDALAQYVAVFEKDQDVAYVFSPTIEYRDGVLTPAPYSGQPEAFTTIFPRSKFYERLIWASTVHAGATMARLTAFKEVGFFPTDLPYAADFYHWCYMALRHKVGYIPTATNLYRKHDLNITDELARRRGRILVNDNVTVRWRMLDHTRRLGDRGAEVLTLKAIANDYALRICRGAEGDMLQGMTHEEVGESICAQSKSERDRNKVTGLVQSYLGDLAMARNDYGRAQAHYRRAVAVNGYSAKSLAKLLNCSSRRALSSVRRAAYV